MAARRGLRIRRFILPAMVVAVAVFALGAKCIEKTSVYVDADGYTHIIGEMHNETDVQGTSIMLRGTLYDASGGVIAQKDSLLCPPDTQPHSQGVFDIRFDNPGIPPHASYDVRPISGKTIAGTLKDPDVVVLSTDAVKFKGVPVIPGFPLSDGDVFFTFDVRNRSGQDYPHVQGCAAAYDNTGAVIATISTELVQFDESDNIVPATLGSQYRTGIFMHLTDVPPNAVQTRGWLWFGNKNDSTSEYRFIVTNPITIQTRQFP